MAVPVHAVYQGELRVEATHGPSGNQLTTEPPTDNGGKGQLFSPTDLVAAALSNCVLSILALVSERHGWDVTGATADVTKEMVTQPVRRIGRLPTVIKIPASAIPVESRPKVEKAVRSCPVHRSLHADIDAPIDFEYV